MLQDGLRRHARSHSPTGDTSPVKYSKVESSTKVNTAWVVPVAGMLHTPVVIAVVVSIDNKLNTDSDDCDTANRVFVLHWKCRPAQHAHNNSE